MNGPWFQHLPYETAPYYYSNYFHERWCAPSVVVKASIALPKSGHMIRARTAGVPRPSRVTSSGSVSAAYLREVRRGVKRSRRGAGTSSHPLWQCHAVEKLELGDQFVLKLRIGHFARGHFTPKAMPIAAARQRLGIIARRKPVLCALAGVEIDRSTGSAHSLTHPAWIYGVARHIRPTLRQSRCECRDLQLGLGIGWKNPNAPLRQLSRIPNRGMKQP